MNSIVDIILLEIFMYLLTLKWRELMCDKNKSNDDENKRLFQENFAPFHGRSKWVMIIIFALLAFYIIASNLN